MQTASDELFLAREAQKVLSHRGPDGVGVWQNGCVTFAHARLKIIDLSHRASQPMTNETGDITVVYNGEIYNFRELRRELEGHDHRFRSDSDTEVLVHGYEEWGVDVLERIDGMFAFGLWDNQRRVLFLARDRVGQKPLFFYTCPPGEGCFTFASEIKALAAGGVALKPRSESIIDYLIYGYAVPPATFYKSVQQVPPAHYLLVSHGDIKCGQVEFKRYWDVSFDGKELYKLQPDKANQRKSPGFTEAAQRVRTLVESAVKKRMISHVPLGAFLSGGLDSTIITGVMSRLSSSPVKTFSIGFSADSRYDETSYAHMAARAFSTNHTKFNVTPQGMGFIRDLIVAHDGPFSDSSAIPTALLAQLTKQHVSVVLTGDGGDELFAGYDRFSAGVFSELLPRLLRNKLALLGGVLPALDERTLTGRVRRFLKGLSLPLPERMLHWQPHFAFSLLSLCRSDLLNEVFGRDDFIEEEDSRELFKFQYGVFDKTRGMSTLARLLDQNFRTYLPNDLQVKMDRCTMAYGLEARSPFLDIPLIVECAGFPDRFKMCCGIKKAVLKYAFRDLVPAQILARRKMGFGVPLDVWFRTGWKKDLVDYLLDPGSMLNEYLRHREVVRYVKEHLSGRGNRGHQLFALLTLELWLRDFSASAPAPAPAVIDA